MLKQAAGIDLVHVPYKGPAPAIQDVLGGQVSMMCDNFSNVMHYVQAGKLKAIAITDEKRNALLPQVPTTSEQGFAQVQAGNWYGFVAPAATPKRAIKPRPIRDTCSPSTLTRAELTLCTTLRIDAPELY